MAQGKTVVITKKFINNSKTATTVNLTVEAVVFDGRLVPDPKDTDPGVIIDNR